MIHFLLLGILLSVPAFAQNPCDPSIMAEMESSYAKLYYSVQCIEIKQRTLLENRDEIERFLSGRLMNEYKDLFRNVLKFYPEFGKKCALPLTAPLPKPELAECADYNRRLRNSPYIKNDALHILLLMNDLTLTQEWIKGGMPMYNFNKMIRYLDLQSAGLRFTYAEIAAGDPRATLATLQYFDQLGLLDPASTESYPLHNAIVNNKMDNIQYLVSRGWDINARAVKPIENYLDPKQLLGSQPQRGTTPLTAAIIHKKAEVFQYLMSLPNIDVNARQLMMNAPPIMVAADGAFFDDNAEDPYYWTIFNNPKTDINAKLSEDSPQTLINQISARYREPKANAGFGKMITALANDPRFKVDEHCNDKNPCLQAFLPPREEFPYDAERFETFEPIIRKMNPEARGYNLVKTKNLTLQEYVDKLIDETPAGYYRRQLKEIRRCIDAWIGTNRSHGKRLSSRIDH